MAAWLLAAGIAGILPLFLATYSPHFLLNAQLSLQADRLLSFPCARFFYVSLCPRLSFVSVISASLFVGELRWFNPTSAFLIRCQFLSHNTTTSKFPTSSKGGHSHFLFYYPAGFVPTINSNTSAGPLVLPNPTSGR